MADLSDPQCGADRPGQVTANAGRRRRRLTASNTTGRATLTFTIARDGKISNIKIAEPSGDAELDRVSFNALTNANPFEPLPKDYPQEEMAMTVSFYYNEQPPATLSKDDKPAGSAK